MPQYFPSVFYYSDFKTKTCFSYEETSIGYFEWSAVLYVSLCLCRNSAIFMTVVTHIAVSDSRIL
jgi:hypothetical protein